MSDTLNLANSIWLNGMKVDSDGHAVFYPLGTNKVKVPTSCAQWPKGNKIVSPFVYQDDKIVGFVDTKAFTTDSQTTIYLPYEHIEAEFSSIDKGLLQIHAPNAITKKSSWKNSGVEDIPEVQYKYKDCKTLDDIRLVDSYYKTSDIVNGTWTELLCDLEDGNPTNIKSNSMFYSCTALTTFNSDLSSLTNGKNMFHDCYSLIDFNSDLSSLTNGYEMFAGCTYLKTFNSNLSALSDNTDMFKNCINIESFNADLSSLTGGSGMFNGCYKLTVFNSDLSSLTHGSNMFNGCSNLTTFECDDLSSLTNGSNMFYCCYKLTEFNSNLSSLTNGPQMFYNCINLTTFTSDLSALTCGEYMFQYCDGLTNFTSDLSSLTNGEGMF